MRESKSNTILNQYLREKRLYCYYELKIARGLYFYFSRIEKHQDEGLPALEKNGLVWKFSDEDSRKKPCDGGCFPPLQAFVVVMFNTSGQYYFIRHEEILKMKEAGEVCINENEAYSMASHIVHA